MSALTQTVIKNLHLESMTPDQQSRFMESVGQTIMMTVMQRALSEMSDADGEAFDAFMETNPSPDDLFTFLQSKVPNLSELIEEEGKAIIAMSGALMDGMQGE